MATRIRYLNVHFVLTSLVTRTCTYPGNYFPALCQEKKPWFFEADEQNDKMKTGTAYQKWKEVCDLLVNVRFSVKEALAENNGEQRLLMGVMSTLALLFIEVLWKNL